MPEACDRNINRKKVNAAVVNNSREDLHRAHAHARDDNDVKNDR